jgi:hypothetical protein
MSMEQARRYPILAAACGPANSIQGASYLSRLSIGLSGCIVREKNGEVTAGPDVVGFEITEKTLGFGGSILPLEKIAGTKPGTASMGIVEIEDVPVQYQPNNTNCVTIKTAEEWE